jgi:hypothetical protein
MSVTIILDITKTTTPEGITWTVQPYLEGMEEEENVMGEMRPIYQRSEGRNPMTGYSETLIACLEDAYANEKAYVESVGETLMKVETDFGNRSITMYSMTGKGTDCTITEEYKALKG